MKQFAVLGEKLSHTLSPQIHGEIFKSLGLNHQYGILEVEKNELSGLPDTLHSRGLSGINVTIPYKQSVIPMLNFISPEAKRIGAVNTVKIENGKLLGYNTDYHGFGAMLERHDIDPYGKRILIFGSGGVSRAVIAYLIDNGARSISVTGRNIEAIRALKEQFTDIKIQNEVELEGDIAINCTPVGMYPNVNESIAGIELIRNYSILIDMIYNPFETRFLKIGSQIGLKSVNGLYMLVEQAIKADEIFLDLEIDKSVGKGVYLLLQNMMARE